MWHSISRNGFSKNLRKQFCLKKCDRVWLFDCNLLSEQSNLSYIKRRYDFQANILKEIHNNHYDLQEYNKHALSISTATFCYQLEETNFSLFCKISTNAFVGFGNRCFFKNMLFKNRFRQLLQGFLLSYLVVEIINHMAVFLSYFPSSSSIFYSSEEKLFESFRKLQ